MFPPSFVAFIHQPMIFTLVVVPLLLISIDVLSGVASALKRGIFTWKQLPSFLGNDLFRYLGGCFLVLLSYLLYGTGIATVISGIFGMGTLSTGIVTSIRENVQEILGTTNPFANAVLEEVTHLQTSLPLSAYAPTTAVIPALQQAFTPQNGIAPSYPPTQFTGTQGPLLLKDQTWHP